MNYYLQPIYPDPDLEESPTSNISTTSTVSLDEQPCSTSCLNTMENETGTLMTGSV